MDAVLQEFETVLSTGAPDIECKLVCLEFEDFEAAKKATAVDCYRMNKTLSRVGLQGSCRFQDLLGLRSLGGLCGFGWFDGNCSECGSNWGRLQCRALVLQRSNLSTDLGFTLIQFD